MRMSSFTAAMLLFLTALAGPAAAADEVRPPSCDSMGLRQIPAEFTKFSVVIPAGIEPSSFYDIGCAVKFRDKECASRQMAMDNNAVVHDYHSGEQLQAQEAFFAVETDIPTPKGYGIVAFKDKAAAEKFVTEHKGRVLKWYQVVDLTLK